MKKPMFIVSKEDWSLHRKGYQDQMRHQQKVRKAIKENLKDLITDESIIQSSGEKKIKVPIRSMNEYRFRYNFNKSKHVGQGNGKSKVGDVLGTDPIPAPGKGKEAGDQPGEDYYDVEVDIGELENILFDQMELPYMKKKEKEQITITDIEFNDIRKKGIMSNLDKKKTILENLKRNALSGSNKIGGITPDDLRYKTWNEVQKPHSNALIIAMMDTSGSMGLFEKYIARSFFFWMTKFLRRSYENVEIVFVAHHTEAKEVSEEAFFTKGESGGTICSSAYLKAIDIIDTRFPPNNHNIYPFHFSDGDNLTSDNDKCVSSIHQLLERCNMFGYGEVNQYNRRSTLMNAYQKIDHPYFLHYIIREKGEVYDALKTFFSRSETG